jgi:cell division protease FtsH
LSISRSSAEYITLGFFVLLQLQAYAGYKLVQWGISDRFGPINLGRGEEHPFLGRELSLPKRYSEEMAWLMDQEIRKMIIDAESRATEILTVKRHTLDALAEALMKEETLERAEVERIIQASKE